MRERVSIAKQLLLPTLVLLLGGCDDSSEMGSDASTVASQDAAALSDLGATRDGPLESISNVPTSYPDCGCPRVWGMGAEPGYGDVEVEFHNCERVLPLGNPWVLVVGDVKSWISFYPDPQDLSRMTFILPGEDVADLEPGVPIRIQLGPGDPRVFEQTVFDFGVTKDTDQDGILDMLDPDDDGNGIADNLDTCPATVDAGVDGARSDAVAAVDAGPVMLDMGLIGHWKFEDCEGGTVTDSSGNENHGTVMEGTSLSSSPVHPEPGWSSGPFGECALDLDGVDDWVRVPESASFDRTATNNQVSISGWIYPWPRADFTDIVVGERPSLAGLPANFSLGTQDGFLSAAVGGERATAYHIHMSQGMFHHVAMSYDGSVLRLYHEGEQVAGRRIDKKIEANGTPFLIGGEAQHPLVDNHLYMPLDELRLYDRALNANEMRALAEM